MSLSNLKCKLIVLKEKIAKLKADSEDLKVKYDKVISFYFHFNLLFYTINKIKQRLKKKKKN